MVFSTTVAEVKNKIGQGSHASAQTSGFLNQMINQAEAFVNVATREDWGSQWGSLSTATKLVIAEAVENLSAIYALNYDMSAITDRIQTEDRMEVLMTRFRDCVRILIDQKGVTFTKTVKA